MITLGNRLSSVLIAVFYPFYLFGIFVTTEINILTTIIKKLENSRDASDTAQNQCFWKET